MSASNPKNEYSSLLLVGVMDGPVLVPATSRFACEMSTPVCPEPGLYSCPPMRTAEGLPEVVTVACAVPAVVTVPS
jgi:hypothetical protein